jgi:hypothetical protein
MRRQCRTTTTITNRLELTSISKKALEKSGAFFYSDFQREMAAIAQKGISLFVAIRLGCDLFRLCLIGEN